MSMLNTFQVTVEVPLAADKEAARRFMEAQGFTVTKVTTPRAKAASVTTADPFRRANSLIDRPAGLNHLESAAYVRGYAAECMRYAKKHGIPRPAEGQSLREATIAYEWERHPTAHRAGLRELSKEQTIRPRQSSGVLESVA